MARIVKEQEYAARRNEILDVAQRLVATKGYAPMTIQDILDELQISKGAFYHYFDSKPALLEAILERMLRQVEALVIPLVERADMPAVEKFHRFLDTAAQWKTEQKSFVLALLRVWYTDENAVVRQKLRARMVKEVAPLLAAIIQQGVQEGVWSTGYPDQVGEVVLSLVYDLSDTVAGHLLASYPACDPLPRMQRSLAAYTEALERVLGAAPGSIQVIDPAILAEWTVSA
ncbi:MAG: TetR/AcrR family transcriptional regulator [Anaerolineae bacterium]|nr:TetR/AcrR family transcriptional regulator [Anaerolineae bacterium]